MQCKQLELAQRLIYNGVEINIFVAKVCRFNESI